MFQMILPLFVAFNSTDVSWPGHKHRLVTGS